MNINVQFRQNENIIRGFVEGEIDTYTAPVLREELDNLRITKGVSVELDLSKVSYMDSTGLGIFVALYKRATREEAEFKLVGLTSRLARLFEITGLSELMDLEVDTDTKVEIGNESV